jgi:uncharacterized protein (DUF302 family)
MSYYFSKIIDGSMDAAIEKVTEALKSKGFGVLTRIDVASTLKSKLGVDFRPYVILGACNPSFAHQALQHERNIGAMLPCNVVVQAAEGDRVEVSAVDPVASMQAVENEQLALLAGQVRKLLVEAVEQL